MILLSNHTNSFRHLITKMVVIVNVNPCDLHDYGHETHDCRHKYFEYLCVI
jgi:hypothetical protein